MRLWQSEKGMRLRWLYKTIMMPPPQWAGAFGLEESMDLFRIGEISKMLNVPVETIRFFEQKGLIMPVKNEMTGYRYYSVWDANQILEYKKYRQIGFSSNEAIAMIKDIDCNGLIDQLESKRKEAVYQAHFYQAKALKLKNFQSILDNAKHLVGEYYIMNRPENYSLYMRSHGADGLRTSTAKETEGAFDELTNYYPFVEHAYRIRKEWCMAPTREYEAQWGFTVKKRWADRLNINILPKMEHQKATTAVFTVIRLGQKQYFSLQLLEGVFLFMKKHGYELNGDIVGVHVATVREEQESVRYVEVWVPVKGLEPVRARFPDKEEKKEALKELFC